MELDRLPLTVPPSAVTLTFDLLTLKFTQCPNFGYLF